MTSDFLAIYPAKLMEYGLAVTYLLLFVPMWRYVQGGRKEAVAQAVRGLHDAERWPAVAVAAPWPSLGWFQVPAGVALMLLPVLLSLVFMPAGLLVGAVVLALFSPPRWRSRFGSRFG